jgi:uncharacterized BrkB/YihY/UPF0761 family membrane protein
MIYKEFNFGGKSNPLGSFGAIIILTIFLIALYFIAKGIFTVLTWAAPVLLILAIVFDYTVITDYGKFIINLFKQKPLYGIIASILSIVGFPIVSGFLFFRAYARKSMKSYQKSKEPKFDEYEEITKKSTEEEFLELRRLESKNPAKKNESEYDNLFN